MKFNDVVYYNTKKGIVKGFSLDSKTVYVEFSDSMALITISKCELKEVK